MLIYGLHPVIARLRHHPQSITRIFYQGCKELPANPRIKNLVNNARKKGIRVDEFPAKRLEAMLPTRVNHQGIACECESIASRYLSLTDCLQQHEKGNILLSVLDQINDPQNLGACLRSADAFGAQAIIVPKDRSAGISDTVSRSAAGAAETVPLIVVTNLARALNEIAEYAITIAGLTGDASLSLWDYQPSYRQCWVFGSEANGLRRLTREKCDNLLAIPMQGSVESLNVSACAAVCLAYSARWLSQNQ